MTIDRCVCTGNANYQQNVATGPMFPVLLEPFASPAYEAALALPTFVSVTASGKLQDDLSTVDIQVSGDVATGILPEGEEPRVTVYLMERDVYSDSQLFWTDKENEEHMGEYTHANVIREILSNIEGDEITAGGDFQKTYQAEIDPNWTLENLYLVAFVHRDGKKGAKYMHVFNSCEGELDVTVDVQDLMDRQSTQPGILYDLMGRKATGTKRGIYILNGKKISI